MRTIERNYRKNPHTASFLQTFHTGISSTGRNYRAEMTPDEANARIREVMENGTAFQPAWMANEARQDDADALALEAGQDDLLNLVPEADVIDNRTAGQVKFMEDLVARLAKLDREIGAQARTYTDGMTEHGKWTAGRTGNASAWIDRMLSKERELTAKVQTPAAPKGTMAIPAGTYAITTDEVRCYTIDYGKEGTRWAGFLFLNRVSSDDRFPVKNPAAKAEILAAIGADIEGAAVLAALTLRRCRRCNRQLSDTKNPYFSMGLGPECGTK